MAANHSIADARSNLPTLVREAEAGKTVRLTRHGKPVAVLIGRREYDQLTQRQRGFSSAFDEFAEAVDLEELDLDPGELFGEARDRTGGREIDL